DVEGAVELSVPDKRVRGPVDPVRGAAATLPNPGAEPSRAVETDHPTWVVALIWRSAVAEVGCTVKKSSADDCKPAATFKAAASRETRPARGAIPRHDPIASQATADPARAQQLSSKRDQTNAALVASPVRQRVPRCTGGPRAVLVLGDPGEWA